MLLDVPVTPDPQTAGTWLRRELADPVYHQRPSLLSRLLEWVRTLFAQASAADTPGLVTTLTIVGGALLLVVVAFWVTGPVRRSRRLGRPGVLAPDDRRTAEQLRADADAAAARGDLAAAVADRFRAVVRSLEERAVLDERPGRTAHEAAADAGARLVPVAEELRRAADLFDAVVYGRLQATADDDAWLRSVDARTAGVRPSPGVASGPPPGEPDRAGVPAGRG